MILAPCNNTDSCEPNTEHWYPEAGETVTVREDIECREVGTMSTFHTLRKGQEYRVDDFMPDFHEAVVIVGDAPVWLDIDDAEVVVA